MTKICTKCGITKNIDEYHNSSVNADRLCSWCKECDYIRNKTYRDNNKDKERTRCKSYRNEHKEQGKIYQQNWQTFNRDKCRTYTKNYKKRHKSRLIIKYNNDFNLKLKCNIRRRILLVLKGIGKSQNTLNLLGCTIPEVKSYLESKFLPGMTWENHGVHGWHIDHIIPCAFFILTDYQEQKFCFHYTNLQPLWAKDNLKKSDIIPQLPC